MTIKFKIRPTQIRTLRRGDPQFQIVDGDVTSGRAGFEIDTSCPEQYRYIIMDSIDRGWLKPVAHITERELLFLGLSK